MTKVEVVSQRFPKFFNYGESLAAEIDWSTARVTEKCDGSIIGLWYDEDQWHISTNGVINAFECDLPLPMYNCESFGDLFVVAACRTTGRTWPEFEELLDPMIMYTCELMSPANRIVVPHKEPHIVLIGARDKHNLKEINVWFNTEILPEVPRPKTYKMRSMQEVLDILPTLPFSEEGYVIMDDKFNRVKAKGHDYLAAHHLKDNGNVNPKRVLELVKANEIDEFLTYFPEYTDIFNKVKSAWVKVNIQIAAALAATDGFKKSGITKKEFASIVMREKPLLRGFMFAAWDGKDIQPLIDKLDAEDILRE